MDENFKETLVYLTLPTSKPVVYWPPRFWKVIILEGKGVGGLRVVGREEVSHAPRGGGDGGGGVDRSLSNPNSRDEEGLGPEGVSCPLHLTGQRQPLHPARVTLDPATFPKTSPSPVQVLQGSPSPPPHTHTTTLPQTAPGLPWALSLRCPHRVPLLSAFWGAS